MMQIFRCGDADLISPPHTRLTTCSAVTLTEAVDKPVVVHEASTTDGHAVPSMILRMGR